MRLFTLLVCSVFLNIGCATFRPYDMTPSIRLVVSEHGGCTAWAVGPNKWITAAHCTATPLTWPDHTPATLLYIDTAADLALLRGPKARPFRIASAHPRLGDPLHVFGYGMGRALMLLPGVYINSQPFFTNSEEFLFGVSNGMPGMSGGPIFVGQRVVSVLVGGGTATSPTHMVGFGVPLRVLRQFVSASGADRY